MTTAGPGGRYGPLLARLHAVPAEQTSIALSFAEIEALTGWPLPAAARRGFFWSPGGTLKVNWRGAGWTARLDLPARAVIFTRQSVAPAPEATPERVAPPPQTYRDRQRVRLAVLAPAVSLALAVLPRDGLSVAAALRVAEELEQWVAR